MDELILCVPNSAISQLANTGKALIGVGDVTGSELFDAFAALGKDAWFIPREVAEYDPDFRQVIPYQVLVQDDKVFLYQRNKKAGEERLQSLWSIGIGGHVNLDDIAAKDGRLDLEATLNKAVIREVSEEIGHVVFPLSRKPLGLIYVSKGEKLVDLVHVGLVDTIQWPKGDDMTTAKDMDHCKWEKLENLSSYNLETWSALCVEYLIKTQASGEAK